MERVTPAPNNAQHQHKTTCSVISRHLRGFCALIASVALFAICSTRCSCSSSCVGTHTDVERCGQRQADTTQAPKHWRAGHNKRADLAGLRVGRLQLQHAVQVEAALLVGSASSKRSTTSSNANLGQLALLEVRLAG